MPRKPRWMQLANDAGFRVMSRGHNRADADDSRYFLQLLERHRKRYSQNEMDASILLIETLTMSATPTDQQQQSDQG